MIVVSSEIEELTGLCTRLLIMREGEIVAEMDGGTATELEVLRHAMPRTQEIVTETGTDQSPRSDVDRGGLP